LVVFGPLESHLDTVEVLWPSGMIFVRPGVALIKWYNLIEVILVILKGFIPLELKHGFRVAVHSFYIVIDHSVFALLQLAKDFCIILNFLFFHISLLDFFKCCS